MRTFAALGGLLVLTASAAAAQGPQRCSRDTFPVNGQSVAVTVCSSGAAGARVPVAETFARGTQSFARSTSIDVLPGAGVSRAVDDVPLAAFAIPYTLHLTLAYRGGAVTIEHALLLPGAVPLK